MNKNVLDTDLSGKVAVVTGAGGVLCSAFAKTLARAGAKVALLDLNEEAAQSFADEITAEGGVAKAYKCNVLDKAVCYEVADAVEKDFGKCDILVNGAGGNNPRATTDKEYFEEGDIDADTKSFFDLDASGVEFVFNLNFLGTLIPTQAFARQMVGREGLQHHQHQQHERLHSAHEDPGVLRCEGRHFQLHPVAGRSLLQSGHPLQRHRSGLLLHQAERRSAVERGRHAHGAHRQDPCRHPDGPLR